MSPPRTLPHGDIIAMREGGVTPTEIARRVGCAVGTVTKLLHLARRRAEGRIPHKGRTGRFRTLPHEKIMAMRDEGLCVLEIAERTGCKIGSITKILSRKGQKHRVSTYALKPPIDDDVVIRALDAGISVERIAQRMGRYPGAIQAIQRNRQREDALAASLADQATVSLPALRWGRP